MAVKSTTTPATPKARSRRKAQSSAVVANIIFIDPERRQASEQRRWEKECHEYHASLSKNDLNIILKSLEFGISNPRHNKHRIDCKVIPFPIGTQLAREV